MRQSVVLVVLLLVSVFAGTATGTPRRSACSSRPASDVSGPVSVSFVSDEAGSTFLCSLSSDGGITLADRRPCWSPKTYSGLEPGGFRFKVHAVDPTGNVGPATSPAAWRSRRCA